MGAQQPDATSTSPAAPPALLEVDDLVVGFRSAGRVVTALHGVSFAIDKGETLGIVGESGSGKTVLMLSVLGLLPASAEVLGGVARLDGEDLLRAGRERLRELRGDRVAMIFQDPMTSLNPVIRVGEQIREAMWVHGRGGSKAEQWKRVIDLLLLVGVPEPARRARQYPHEFSGGMRQRAMIAMAIANDPALLVADEPTTALDVTIQAQVMDVLMAAKAATGAATILVTHDLGLVAEVADRVMVMYAGRIVERGTTADLFDQPAHPYTVGLLASRPSLGVRRTRLPSIPGQPPSIGALPTGCPFRTRCAVGRHRSRCAAEVPALLPVAAGHDAACHFVDDVREWAEGRDG